MTRRWTAEALMMMICTKNPPMAAEAQHPAGPCFGELPDAYLDGGRKAPPVASRFFPGFPCGIGLTK